MELRYERIEIRTGAEPIRPQLPTNETRTALRSEPSSSPVMFQTWENLAFLHWEWPVEELQQRLPRGLNVDTFEGKAYVAVTPFFMSSVRASFLPEVPGTANFLELNVRTYVYDRNGVPGVWFLSLDCNQGLAVRMARFFYSLPYHDAAMEAAERSGVVEYRCRRAGARDGSEIHYKKLPEPLASPVGSLPFFLTERYLLYSSDEKSQKLYRARVWHMPWQLFRAHLGRWDSAMLQVNGLNPKLREPDHVCIGAPVRVKIFGLEEAPA